MRLKIKCLDKSDYFRIIIIAEKIICKKCRGIDYGIN